MAGRRAHLRQRARLLRQVLALPFGDERIGPGEGVLEVAARGQRLLEVRAAEVGEVVPSAQPKEVRSARAAVMMSVESSRRASMKPPE